MERNERLLVNTINRELRKIEDSLSMKLPFDDEEFDDEEEDSEEAIDFRNIFEETVKKLKDVKNSSSRRKRIQSDMQQTSFFDDLD